MRWNPVHQRPPLYRLATLRRRLIPLWLGLPDGVRRRLRIIRSASLTVAPSNLRRVFLQSPLASIAARHAGATIVHCFGDSHAWVFDEIRRSKGLPSTWLSVDAINGATALGLKNPNSKTAALPSFLEVIDRLPTDRTLLFMLGEVDCGYLVWVRADKYGLSIDDQLTESFSSYVSFFRDLGARGFSRIIVSAIPPPTILDDQDWGEVARLRGSVRAGVVASLSERTALTRRYNEMLRNWCEHQGYRFLDFEKDVIDPETGLVRASLLHEDPSDHHLNPDVFGRVAAQNMQMLGFR